MTLQRTKHKPTIPPSPAAAPALPSEVAALQAQLTLARAQNAYLHRELATAKRQAPVATGEASGSPEEQAAVITDLRERLQTLTWHYDDAIQARDLAQHQVRQLDAQVGDLLQALCGGRARQADQIPLTPEVRRLDGLMKALLTICHPDRWAQGQLASELAHVLATEINQRRADGRRP